VSRARRRDRAVYLGSHPVLFALIGATRRAAVRRIGRTVLVHGTDAYLDALTRVPLDRAAAGTTGGVARDLAVAGVLFDEEGVTHRGARRSVAEPFSASGVERLRPVWQEVLARRLAPLGDGGRVDAVDVTLELAGATTAAMLDLPVRPRALAEAARDAAAAAAREHLPGPRLPRGLARETAARLVHLAGGERAAMLAVASVNTTVAALPRAVAWCADDGLWAAAAGDATRPALADELLRVLAPTPVLPRVAAADATVGGCPVRAGDRLVLVARHAAESYRRDPDPAAPVPARTARLVFGAGPHACPGARLARVQLADTLAAFAPYRPVVVRRRVDRRAALPGWSTVEVRAS
jgi:cytochrome P450